MAQQDQSPAAIEASKDRAAALTIQKNYRGYRTRRSLNGCALSADDRWGDAALRLRREAAGKQNAEGSKNSAADRWRRGGLMVGQFAGDPVSGDAGAGGGEGSGSGAGRGAVPDDGPVEGGPSLPDPEGEAQQANGGHGEHGEPEREKSHGMIGDVPGGQSDGKVDNVPSVAHQHEYGLKLLEKWTRGAKAQQLSKMMEESYWLEGIDVKHRYGSNLKHYHSVWMKADTDQNFFHWLDKGDGKEVDLEECPRDRLESEKVTYLSAEQRFNYLVDIKEGRLFWRRNGKPVDTSRGKHKDLGEGRGIVELGPEEQEEEARIKAERRAARHHEQGPVSVESLSSESSSSSSSSSDADSEELAEAKEDAKHYGADLSKKERRLGLLTSKGWTDALMRKTVGVNTWIYVLNSRHELYIGIKKTGTFQHSSFLYGGRVLSAGLIKLKDGMITSLSPLSGHYKANSSAFRWFVASLQAGGVDLSHVSISKALLALMALEQYGKLTKKTKAKKASKKEDKQNAVIASAGRKRNQEAEGEQRQTHNEPDARNGTERAAEVGAAESATAEQASHAPTEDAEDEAAVQARLKAKLERDRPRTLFERTFDKAGLRHHQKEAHRETRAAKRQAEDATSGSEGEGGLSRILSKISLHRSHEGASLHSLSKPPSRATTPNPPR